MKEKKTSATDPANTSDCVEEVVSYLVEVCVSKSVAQLLVLQQQDVNSSISNRSVSQ